MNGFSKVNIVFIYIGIIIFWLISVFVFNNFYLLYLFKIYFLIGWLIMDFEIL